MCYLFRLSLSSSNLCDKLKYGNREYIALKTLYFSPIASNFSFLNPWYTIKRFWKQLDCLMNIFIIYENHKISTSFLQFIFHLCTQSNQTCETLWEFHFKIGLVCNSCEANFKICFDTLWCVCKEMVSVLRKQANIRSACWW